MPIYVPKFEAGGLMVPSAPPDPKALQLYLLYWATRIELYLAAFRLWKGGPPSITEAFTNPATRFPWQFQPIGYEASIPDGMASLALGIEEASSGFDAFLAYADAFGDAPSYANEQSLCGQTASLLGWCLTQTAAMIPQAEAIITISNRSSQSGPEQAALDVWTELLADFKTELVTDFPGEITSIFLLPSKPQGARLIGPPVPVLAGSPV